MKIVIFICENKTGPGHINRCKAIADYIRKKMRVLPIFITNNEGFEQINKEHLTFKTENDAFNQITYLNPDLVVFDQAKTTKKLIHELKKIGVRTMNLYHLDPNRNHCDTCISPIETKKAGEKNYYEGANYAMLRNGFYKRRHKIKRKVKKVIIYAKNKESLEFINKVINGIKIKKTYIVKNKTRDDEVSYQDEISETLRNHDLAIVPMNHTLFECLAVGIPTIIISHDEQEEETAKRFTNTDAAIHLGRYDKIKINKSKKVFNNLCRAVAKRKNMAWTSRNIINRKANENIYKIFRKELLR